jgi:hypothetical protein
MLVPLTDRSNPYTGMMLRLIADEKARTAAKPRRTGRAARKLRP